MHSACNATADPDQPSLCAIDFSSGWTSYTGGEPGYGTTVQVRILQFIRMFNSN